MSLTPVSDAEAPDAPLITVSRLDAITVENCSLAG
jgi:hypothetical protein